MKKAIIDQILLGFILFSSLVVIGATVSDKMQARDKYYNLKQITDNAVLGLAKYYVQVENSTSDAQDIYNNILEQTKLGLEVKDDIVYTWDFDSSPNNVVATIANYEEETFWFKFLGLNSFNLKVESKAKIVEKDLTTATSTYSSGLAPFAINDQSFSIGTSLNIDYELTASWQYSHKNSFYPVVTDCDCDCSFILSNKFDFSSLGFDVDSCNSSSSACTTHGQSEFVHYSRLMDDIYNSEQSIDFEEGQTSSPICLLGTYLGNSTSTWGTQINHLSSGIYDIIGASGSNLPIEMDILTLDETAKANGIVRVRIDSYDFKTNGNPNGRYLTLNTTIVPAKAEKIELVY